MNFFDPATGRTVRLEQLPAYTDAKRVAKMGELVAAPRPQSSAETVGAVVVNLFHVRTYAHLLHLSSTSYAQHMALDELYNGLPGLIDAWVESYQGLYGRITSYPNLSAAFVVNDPVSFVDACITYLKNARYETPQDSELQNALDEILALMNSVAYKLKNLK